MTSTYYPVYFLADMDDLSRSAINAALTRDWKTAIKANLSLLKQNPKDIDALNRLGRAYFETGQKTKAEGIYKKVLRLDKFNSIATKSLDLLKTSRLPRRSLSQGPPSAPPPVFLEEPGITKTISLIRPGDPRIISRLHPGDAVSVIPRDHIISVTSTTNEYLGRLPDDLTSRLLPLMRSGNRYSAWVRSVEGGLKVFIKEIYKSAKHKNTPSFPVTEKLSYAAFTPPELVHTEKPDVTGTEEQEEAVFTESESDEPNSDRPAPEDL